MIVIARMLNEAFHLTKINCARTFSSTEKTSAVTKLGILRFKLRCVLWMVAQRGHARSYCLYNIGRLRHQATTSQLKAQFTCHRPSRNVSSQNTCNANVKDSPKEGRQKPAEAESHSKPQSETTPLPTEPRTQESNAVASQQTPVPTTAQKSLLRIPDTERTDGRTGKLNHVSASSQRQAFKSAELPSVEKNTVVPTSASSSRQTPKTSAASKTKSKKKVPDAGKKDLKQQKGGSTNPGKVKSPPAKPKPQSKADTGNQAVKTGKPQTKRSNTSNPRNAKTASVQVTPKFESKSKAEKRNQGNMTGNRTTVGNTSTNQKNATTYSARDTHLANNAKSKTKAQEIKESSRKTDSTTDPKTAGQPLGQRSSETTGQRSSQVMRTPPDSVSSENFDSARIRNSTDSQSAITNEPSAILPCNFLTASKNNFFSVMQFKSMRLPQTTTSSKRLNAFADEFHATTFLDSAIDEDIGRLNERIRIKAKAKSAKKEKRHNWTIVKTPQAYLQPFMDVSIFCCMVQEAQALFDSARQHSQPLETEHYNTMLQAWARKGDLGQIRSLFAQMISSQVKPDLQSYAAALECMGRMKDTDHVIVTKCLEQMESEQLSVADIFNVCTFTNDSREVILGLLQDVLPGFEAPPPVKRPQCRLRIVEDLYGEGNSTPKMDVSSNAVITQDKIRSKLDEQMAMEKIETVMIPSVEQENPLSHHTLQKRAILEEHRQLWQKALLTALKFEIQKLAKMNNPRRATVGKLNFYPFLSIMEPEEYVELMLEALQNLATSTEGSMTVSLSRELGYKVQRKFFIRRKIKTGVADKLQKLYKQFVTESVGVRALNHRELWQSIEDRNPEGPTVNADVYGWPATITLGLGSLLADVMIREVKINVNMANSRKDKKMIPALYYMYTYRSFKQVGYVKPHPSLVELLQQAKKSQMPFESNLLPMLTPPIPWTSVKFGAYPLSTTKIMRCRDGTPQHQLLLEKSKSAELYPVLDSLNQLAAVPWKVNKPILDVIISVFRDGGSEVLDIPQLASVLPSMPKPTGEATQDELTKVQHERAALRKKLAEMHSQRMDMLYKLSIADKYRDEVMWFPHNMDFRGRVYPCPPYLNHIGSDVSRSTLLFAKGLPLGKDGLDWLKIHLVNLTGHKKRCSLAERLAYATEMLPEIIDSAENPLNGFGWWTTAEDKWQVLACCMEINKILNHAGHHSTYVSHLPIHQDGSCNGLQHYAALGRDVIGAQQVNLSNTKVPQDVYSGVAEMVEDICKKDAESGIPLAQMLQGQIHRKVVKQTVMTVVYGVTLYGGKLQILKQLKENGDIPPEQMQYAAGYLVLKVFHSLRKMFTKTREIQDWLTECAWLIAKAGQTVEWVTPLGLPVVQPYHKKNLRVINHADHIMYHEDRNDSTERPDTIKQKNAFPPNFIHSLDSTHMMLTSLYCHRAGIDFASVHDCFWTHACCISEMNKICREQFVRLHSEEILQDLADFLMHKYGHLHICSTAKLLKTNPEFKTIGDFIVQVPEKGDFNLKKVLQSTFFFS
ncbi:DNA-directed RNA polymerase, mitochondrial-like [Patiria miniata]|uniref:DNA-directed RNA polymerase n=1 Tax=Patiria miniata TaxID=46514 RepID=A0A914AAS5_PATMI|nr:DNA-directed RNA polymerase, mitochondrial-like [Patiria miniata]